VVPAPRSPTFEREAPSARTDFIVCGQFEPITNNGVHCDCRATVIKQQNSACRRATNCCLSCSSMVSGWHSCRRAASGLVDDNAVEGLCRRWPTKTDHV
jgi:hypothetical protein